MLARQTPGGESRPVPIGSRLIGVSLRPAIPRRVAPQQSPPPLHQSATIVAELATPIKCEARPHRWHLGCHLYFARRVTFLSCADIGVSPSGPRARGRRLSAHHISAQVSLQPCTGAGRRDYHAPASRWPLGTPA